MPVAHLAFVLFSERAMFYIARMVRPNSDTPFKVLATRCLTTGDCPVCDDFPFLAECVPGTAGMNHICLTHQHFLLHYCLRRSFRPQLSRCCCRKPILRLHTQSYRKQAQFTGLGINPPDTSYHQHPAHTIVTGLE